MRAVPTLLLSAALAAAAPSPVVVERAATTSQAPIKNQSELGKAIDGLIADGKDLAMGGKELLGVLNAIVPISKPGSIPEALQRLGQIYSTGYKNLFQSGAELIYNSIATLPSDGLQILGGESVFNSQNNFLNRPAAGIYPKSAGDAPYSQSESALRNSIYIPPGFTYGKVRPLIFIPGTGGYAGQHFASNAGKLFAGSSFADPVYLNIPGAQLDDIQVNSEYIAYAINYISAVSGGKNVSLYTWSAGALGARWALKYWPSTAKVTQNAVSVSADFHGTTLAYLLDPQYPRFPTTPAIVQQEYNATFIATILNNGGDAPKVPLTNVFSAFDEIVEPQGGTGKENASGYSGDKNNVGVTNVLLQETCGSGLPAGTVYNDHESILFNPITIAVAKDALIHGGAADLSRINTTAECLKFAADGITLEDILATEATIPLAAVEIAEFSVRKPTPQEPKIKDYARKDIPAGYCDGC